jgi:hypothetical protein
MIALEPCCRKPLPVRQLATSIAALLYSAPTGFSSARKICAKKRQLKSVQSAAAF